MVTSAAQILQRYRERFINEMLAKDIAMTLQQIGVISEEVAADIKNAESVKDANDTLYNHMQSQASENDFKLLYQVCSNKRGCSKMNAFGTDMARKLDQRGKAALAVT